MKGLITTLERLEVFLPASVRLPGSVRVLQGFLGSVRSVGVNTRLGV